MSSTSADPHLCQYQLQQQLLQDYNNPKNLKQKKLAMGYSNRPFSLSMTRLLLNELVVLGFIFASTPAQCVTDSTDGISRFSF